jgi:TP901 family phage tail tape measure protein
MAFVVPTIFTAINRLSPTLMGMGKDIKVFGDRGRAAIARHEMAFRKLTPAISDTSKQLLDYASSAAIAAAVVGTAAFSAKSIMAYETELQNLKAITGTSGAAFDVFKGKIKDVSNETKSSAVDVAQAFTAIANNQPALLDNADALAAVTKSSIILAQASRMELQPAGEALTQILNQFGKGADYAATAVDILAAGSVKGSSEIRDTADAIQKFGTVAANAGIKMNESVALIELASKFEKGADAGVKLRNILLMLSTAKVQDPKAVHDMHRLGVNMSVVSNSALPLSQRLKEMAKVAKDDGAIFHIFGKENQALATGVLATAGNFDKMLDSVNKTGEAQRMANENNNTLAVSLTQLRNKFVTWLVTSKEAAASLVVLKNMAHWLADNMTTILKVTGYLISAFVVWKGLIWAAKSAMFVYNVVMGINAAVTGASAFATMGSNAAYIAFRATIIASTIAAKAWNLVLMLNPVADVVLVVMALVVALGYVIKNYKSIEELHSSELSKKKAQGMKDETSAVLAASLAYQKYGYSRAEAQKKAILSERENLLSEVTALRARHASAATDSDRRVAELGMATAEGKLTALNNADEGFQTINSKVDEITAQKKFMAVTKNANVNINIKDKNNSVDASSDNEFVNIFTSSTMAH